MYEMSGRPNLFHFFAVVSLVTLSWGLWAIWRYQHTRNTEHLITHQHCMVWAYFGLFMAGFWQVAFNLVRSDIIDVSVKMLYNGLGFLTALISIATFLILAKTHALKSHFDFSINSTRFLCSNYDIKNVSLIYELISPDFCILHDY